MQLLITEEKQLKNSQKKLELQKHYIHIPYRAILNRDISRVKYFIKNLELSEYNGKLRNNIGVKLFGYPKRDGEMEFEIYEVRMWVKELLKECPYLFYYLTENLEIARNMFLCLACINGYEKYGNEIRNIDFFKSETRAKANRIREEALKYELSMHKEKSKELQEMLDRILAPF